MTLTITPTGGDLRARRLRLDLSQSELAKHAECALSTLALFEQGWRPCHSAALTRVVAVLDELEPPRFEGYDHTMTFQSSDTAGPARS